MRRLSPSARLACGALVFATCLVVPVPSPPGIGIACGAVVGWVTLCGLPRRRMLALSLYCMALFLPLFLLTPWLEGAGDVRGHPWLDAAEIPLAMSLRGTACVFVCASTMAVLDVADFGAALGTLPIPRIIQHLLMQIAHQTAMLTNESQRISAAVRIRGLPSDITSKLRFLPALPTIWLLRIMNRADRIGTAMDLRGFEFFTRSSPANFSLMDGLAVTTALLMLGASLSIRWLQA
jgi:energy-coupling factor transporter transmembrane protein EcfT